MAESYYREGTKEYKKTSNDFEKDCSLRLKGFESSIQGATWNDHGGNSTITSRVAELMVKDRGSCE